MIQDAEGNVRTIPFFAIVLFQHSTFQNPDQAVFKVSQGQMHPKEMVNIAKFALSFRDASWKALILNEKEEVLWIGTVMQDNTIKEEWGAKQSRIVTL